MAFKKLIVRWDKRQKYHVISFPRKCDGNLIHSAIFSDRMYQDFNNKGAINFEDSIAKELVKRGYDMTTLRFEISPLK